jgi:hypothetical protein
LAAAAFQGFDVGGDRTRRRAAFLTGQAPFATCYD